jgi:hypothetical protein
MGARNRVGIGLSYRRSRLQRLTKLVPWNRFLGSLKFKNSGSSIGIDSHLQCMGRLGGGDGGVVRVCKRVNEEKKTVHCLAENLTLRKRIKLGRSGGGGEGGGRGGVQPCV